MADTKPLNNQQRKPPASDEMLIRRRLLKLGAYVPPAIMGMMIFGTGIASASAVSCCPKICSPCKVYPKAKACADAKKGKKCKP